MYLNTRHALESDLRGLPNARPFTGWAEIPCYYPEQAPGGTEYVSGRTEQAAERLGKSAYRGPVIYSHRIDGLPEQIESLA